MLESFQGISPRVGESVYIAETALLIGSIEIEDQASIWPGTVIRADVNSIKIGEGTNIQDNSVLHVTHKHAENPSGYPLKIGRFVTVGHRVILHGCSIGNYCLIGMGSIILDGATLDDEVIIGAGSLITEGKHLKRGFLYLGTPAKPIRELTKKELALIQYSAKHYIELKNKYIKKC